jgi:thiamine-monophosphate kinase
MAEQQRTEIGSLGEFGLIDRITSPNKLQNESSKLGIGDDAAVLRFPEEQEVVISTDLLVEGIHFDLMYSPLKHLGYKSIAVNVSDICAMNAMATQVTVSIGLSNRFSVEAIEELYEGIYAACKNFKVDLVGGDTSSSNKGMIISVTAIGHAQTDKISKRSGAKIGDLICITGNLGAAYLGLQILEREKQLYISQPEIQPDLEDQNYLIERQLKPEPRVDIIELFAEQGLVPTSMIDVSDGLVSELMHICKASGVGAYIEESGVPIHPDSEMQALKFGMDPITCALYGGEDYELLFTIDPADMDKVKYLPDIYVAGEIVSVEDGIKLHTRGGKIHDINKRGWQHFKGEE